MTHFTHSCMTGSCADGTQSGCCSIHFVACVNFMILQLAGTFVGVLTKIGRSFELDLVINSHCTPVVTLKRALTQVRLHQLLQAAARSLDEQKCLPYPSLLRSNADNVNVRAKLSESSVTRSLSYAGKALPVTFIPRAASASRIHTNTIQRQFPSCSGLACLLQPANEKSCRSQSAANTLIVRVNSSKKPKNTSIEPCDRLLDLQW
jgi:hypothetical protein